jgi:hypothetical protein
MSVVMQRDTGGARRGGMTGMRSKDAFMLLINAMAISLEVFMHRDFGGRFISQQALVAAFLIPGYSLFWDERSLVPMACFYLLFVVFAVINAIRAYRRMRRGQSSHSRYSGRPKVLKAFPRLSEEKAKAYIEPLLALGVGLILLDVNQPFSVFLCFAGTCMHISARETERSMRRRAMDMNDAVCEQQDVAERFRVLQGE